MMQWPWPEKPSRGIWAVVEIDITQSLGKAEKLNITLPGYLLNRIDEYVKHHPEKKPFWVSGVSSFEGLARGLG